MSMRPAATVSILWLAALLAANTSATIFAGMLPFMADQVFSVFLFPMLSGIGLWLAGIPDR